MLKSVPSTFFDGDDDSDDVHNNAKIELSVAAAANSARPANDIPPVKADPLHGKSKIPRFMPIELLGDQPTQKTKPQTAIVSNSKYNLAELREKTDIFLIFVKNIEATMAATPKQ